VAHFGFSSLVQPVFPPSFAAADECEQEEEQPRHLKPQDVGSSLDGPGGSAQSGSGGPEHLVPLLRIQGQAGKRAQSGSDRPSAAAVLACVAQTMILRPLLNKIVPQAWDGENIPR